MDITVHASFLPHDDPGTEMTAGGGIVKVRTHEVGVASW